jgi:hypothetical protein
MIEFIVSFIIGILILSLYCLIVYIILGFQCKKYAKELYGAEYKIFS